MAETETLQIANEHLIEKYLKKEFGAKKQYVHSPELSAIGEGVEIYGYKGAVILVRGLDNRVEFRISPRPASIA